MKIVLEVDARSWESYRKLETQHSANYILKDGSRSSRLELSQTVVPIDLRGRWISVIYLCGFGGVNYRTN